MNGLRNHLNHLDRQASFSDTDDYPNTSTNAGQPMTGVLPNTIQDGDDGADADEELDDADGTPGLPHPHW